MASRTWLAVALCFFVWFAYLKWFAPPPTHPTPSPQGTATPSTPSTPPASNPTGVSPFSLSSIPVKPIYQVKNEKAEVSFSDIGGKVSRIGLVQYHRTIDKNSEVITPVSPEISTLSLATLFSDKELQGFSDGKYDGTQEGNRVLFRKEERGVKLAKQYEVKPGEYTIETGYHFSFPAEGKREWGYLMIPVGAMSVEFKAEDPLRSWEVVAYQNESITRKHPQDLDKEILLQGNTQWAAFGNRYFSTALLNQAKINPDVLFTKTPDFLGTYLRYPLVLKPGQTELDVNLTMYSGPKDYTDLSRYPGLRQLIDYGMFRVLAYPLLELLRFFYKFVHNYGVAIILLTLLVRILFYPLSVKSFRSMKEMQKLQPQIQALKEKYKDDMQRMNQEQMALFKAHKVNPMGGCLPMLVQLPIFMALYAVLGGSIELFHAPFFGWIKDLSAKDPYYIFPVLMGISMLLQQKMTPNMGGMDPVQQKMMMLMPLVFTFFMVNLPSGLTIYIFLSTLLGIIQQTLINRDSGTKLTKLAPVRSGGEPK